MLFKHQWFPSTVRVVEADFHCRGKITDTAHIGLRLIHIGITAVCFHLM